MFGWAHLCWNIPVWKDRSIENTDDAGEEKLEAWSSKKRSSPIFAPGIYFIHWLGAGGELLFEVYLKVEYEVSLGGRSGAKTYLIKEKTIWGGKVKSVLVKPQKVYHEVITRV